MDVLIGDPAKAGKKLRWKPKTTFRNLVRMMVEADMKRVQDETGTDGNGRKG